jgi:hypothetical protein
MPYPVVPVVPSRAFEGERDKKINLFTPEKGVRQSRVKSGAAAKLNMVHNNRPKKEFIKADLSADLTTMKTFWEDYYDGSTLVQVTHPYTGETMIGYIDSGLKERWDWQNLVSFSWVFQQEPNL